MDYIEIPDYIAFLTIAIAVLVVSAIGFLLSITAHRIYMLFQKPKRQSRHYLQIEHISRVYNGAKTGVYQGDMKAALDGLQELRNIACEQAVLNDSLSN